MSQTGAAGSRRSDRDEMSLPPVIAEFDPVGEIRAVDQRSGSVDAGANVVDRRATAGRRVWSDSRAAERAAVADAFAARFGVDEEGPSAESLADRFGFRYEASQAEFGLPVGRRTVTITGRGADRGVPPAERSVPRARRAGLRGRDVAARQGSWSLHADRLALWAVGLALLLAFAAATSAHAAPH